MKKLIVLTLAMVFVFGTLTYAAKPSIYKDAYTAVDKDQKVNRIVNQHTRAGFQMQSQQDYQIFYFMAPTSTHEWGTFVYTMTRKHGDYSLTVDYAKITIHVECVMPNGVFQGYRVSRVVTEEYTVY